jgi:hypothetical protein
MSHSTVYKPTDVVIRDLDVLGRAAARCGLQLNRNATDYGSYAGRRLACDHSISIPQEKQTNASSDSYEIGVLENKTKDGIVYDLSYDNWKGAAGIDRFCGKNLCNVFAYYRAEELIDEAVQNGCLSVTTNEQENSVQLVLEFA